MAKLFDEVKRILTKNNSSVESFSGPIYRSKDVGKDGFLCLFLIYLTSLHSIWDVRGIRRAVKYSILSILRLKVSNEMRNRPSMTTFGLEFWSLALAVLFYSIRDELFLECFLWSILHFFICDRFPNKTKFVFSFNF